MSFQLDAATPWRVGFVVAGAQKSGTTALASYLGDHPEICMPGTQQHPRIKELHHFDTDGIFARKVVDHTIYHSHFQPRAHHRVIGEATPSYMYWESAPRRMQAYNPAMKLIILLRDPATRAYSHWNMEVKKGRENMSFEEALRLEPERLRAARPAQDARRSYLDRGYYSVQLARIWAVFPREQTLVLRSDALRTDPAATLGRIASFLEVAPFPAVAPRTLWALPYERPMSDAARAFMQQAFAGEIAELERLLGWDLSDWRKD